MPWNVLGQCDACRLVAALGVVISASGVGAQGLNLGPTTPRAGEGRGALALADRLDREAQEIEQQGAPARAAIRTLGAALLRKGEEAGEQGAQAVLAGLTLAAKREALDAELAGVDRSVRVYIASVVRETEVSALPREVDLLLRDALAPLASGSQGGWWRESSGAELGPELDRIEALCEDPALSDEGEARLREFVSLARSGRDEPGYVGAALEWSVLVLDASGAMGDLPMWVDMPARDRMREDFDSACALIFADPTDARALLRRVATVLRLIERTDALEKDLQTRDVRDAINGIATAGDGHELRDSAIVAQIESVYADAIALVQIEPATSADLVRAVRPMVASVARTHRDRAAAVARLLPTLLKSPDPATDPSVLASLAALRASADDMALPQRLTRVLAASYSSPATPPPVPGREPRASSDAALLVRVVQQHAIEVGRDGTSTPAIEALRRLAWIGDKAMGSAALDEMRSGRDQDAWMDVTGSHRDRLVFLFESARDDWLIKAASDDAPANAERLLAYAEVIEVLHEAAIAQRLLRGLARERPVLLNAWPGVELTSQGFGALASDLRRASASLASLAARDDDAFGVRSRVVSFRDEHAAALVLARLEIEATRRFGGRPTTVEAELSCGPPAPDAWMVEQRQVIATVCRAAFEAGAATEDERRDAFLLQARRSARELGENWPTRPGR